MAREQFQPAVRRGAEPLFRGGSCVLGGASPPCRNRVRAGDWFAHSPSPASSVHPVVRPLQADFAEGFCSPLSRVQRGQRVTSPGFTLLSSISDFVVPWDQPSLTHSHNAWGSVPRKQKLLIQARAEQLLPLNKHLWASGHSWFLF